VEPEDFRGINAVNSRQRVVAVLVAVNVGQRHVSVQLLQQAEPFPDKPGSDRLAGWLPAQHLTARFADASSERIVAEADLRLRPVASPRLTNHLRQAMFAVIAVVPASLTVIFLHGAAVDVITPANAVHLCQAVVRDLLSRAFERVTGASQRRDQRRGDGRWALPVRRHGDAVDQGGRTRCGWSATPACGSSPVELIAGKIGDRQLIESRASEARN